MNLVTVTHRTTYRYAQPVVPLDHELMLRPLASLALRVLSSRVAVSPDAALEGRRDRYGNAVETATFPDAATRSIEFVSRFTVLHRPETPERLSALARACARMPPSAAAMPALREDARPRRPDPAGRVEAWARAEIGHGDAFEGIAALSSSIRTGMRYARRDAYGTQDPHVTLERGGGTCRDFAFLLVEAARRLGRPARFVSGYLYEVPGSGTGAPVGGMCTHAWARVHFAGPGWVDFDPTNGIVGGAGLLPSATVLEPREATPLHGSFIGFADDLLGLDVDVTASARPAPSAAAEPALPAEPVALRV